MGPKETKWRAEVRRMLRALQGPDDEISFSQPIDCLSVADHIAWLTIVRDEAEEYEVVLDDIGDEQLLKASVSEACYCPPETRREPSTISAEVIQRHNHGRDR